MSINQPESIDKIIDIELQTEYENQIKIAACLNELEEIIEPDPEYQSPIKIEKKNILAIPKTIQIKIKYLKQKLMYDCSTKSFSLIVFEAFFIKENDDELNYDKLKEKIDLFKVILKTYKSKDKTENEQKTYIKKTKEEKANWKKLIIAFETRLTFASYHFCAILNYSENLKYIMDFIYNFLTLLYSFYVDSSLKNLKECDEQQISKFFATLLIPGHTNYFEIYIENRTLKERLTSPEDANQAINEESKEISNLTVSTNQIQKKEQKEKKRLKRKIRI